MTGTKQIPISHICSTVDNESEDLLMDETLMQVCYTDEYEVKSNIVD